MPMPQNTQQVAELANEALNDVLGLDNPGEQHERLMKLCTDFSQMVLEVNNQDLVDSGAIMQLVADSQTNSMQAFWLSTAQ